MATFTVGAWLFTAILSGMFIASLREIDIHLSNWRADSGILAFTVVALIIGWAIHYDIYGIFFGDDLLRFLSISGLVALGLVSSASLLLLLLTKKRSRKAPSFGSRSWLKASLQMIGAVSSILGIIAFYLDYLR